MYHFWSSQLNPKIPRASLSKPICKRHNAAEKPKHTLMHEKSKSTKASRYTEACMPQVLITSSFLPVDQERHWLQQ
jgi:hypothetical protein